MIKHVAKHNQKKCVVLYKKVPGEDHMCLIVYSDALPSIYHDALMKAVESPEGQNANEFAEALGRVVMSDGRPCLATLHTEGFIRKVPTNQVILTPTPSTTMRLDELNTMLDEMASGKEAKEKLAEYDSNMGMQTKNDVQIRSQDIMESVESVPTTSYPGVSDGMVLSDEAIAREQLSQAERMEREAKELIAESKRIKNEAYKMAPELKPKTRSKKTTAKKAPGKKTTVKKTTGTRKKTAAKKASKVEADAS